MPSNAVLVTGAAGFIGFHVARRLLEQGHPVVGIDNLNDYYDVGLKQARLARLENHKSFSFKKLDLADREGMQALFADAGFSHVVHLAAQVGVRYSLKDPHAYIDANLQGFLNVLEGCRQSQCRHLLYASSSSVYGANVTLPFSVHDNVDHPVSLYAATKKANELMAHSYSHLFGIAATGLRFFTVYGPWGRPDMAVYGFANAIVEGRPIRLFNHGKSRRDFTYVDDAVESLIRLIDRVPRPSSGPLNPSTSTAPWRVYNIGNNTSVEVSQLVALLEDALGRKAATELVAMQPGDIADTCADIDDLERDIGFRPQTPIDEGIRRFVAWYREYHGV